MKAWFQTLTAREQTYVLVTAVVVALWLLYQLALSPLARNVSQMEMNNVAAAQLLTRVDAKVAQLQSLRTESGKGEQSNLTAVISRSSELAGLPVKRLQPNSRGEVQLRFESVDYDALVRWLHQIEVIEKLVILDASISQAGRSGGVNASIRVARAG